jgi:putative acyl-CoA dehydrogenase
MIGMAMTEKQGGSDLRSTQTRARRLSADWYELRGHKWFCSAPMSDGFLTLALLDGAITCFLVPRVLPDGQRNRFLIQRLKDKVGNRSTPPPRSSTTARSRSSSASRARIATSSRWRTSRASTSWSRCRDDAGGAHQALHHCAHRVAFGRRLDRSR